jgi:hypothetical protein
VNNPKTPYHAIGNYDAFGAIPFLSRLPPEEEDFASITEARDWLGQRGGGVIEQCLPAQRWQRIERVAPASSETAQRC